MTAAEFGQAACPNHQGDPYAPPWLACRFAHVCDLCAEIVEDAMLGDLGPLAQAHRVRSRLAEEWAQLHAQWSEYGVEGGDPRKLRLGLVARIVDADRDLAGLLGACSRRWDEERPHVVEDVLYVLDPPLGIPDHPLSWKLGGRLVAWKAEAGDVQPGRDPGEAGITLPVSPWSGRFFMIQDVPDPDREGRTVARYVEVTPFVRIQALAAGKAE